MAEKPRPQEGAEGPAILEPSPGAIMFRRARRDWGVMLGGGIMLALLIVALAAPLLTWHDPLEQDLLNRYAPPVWHEEGSWNHPFGTDKFGRDYYARIVYGARVSLMIGFAVMLISGVIGTVMGVAAGYFGGRLDMIVTFMINTRLAMPVVLIALAVIALTGSSLEIVIAVLGLPALGAVRAGDAQLDATGAQSRLCGGGGGGRLLGAAHPRHRDHAERDEQSDRGGDAGGRARHPAGGRAVLPRPRRAAAGAVLGADDRRGQGRHVFQALGDRHSRASPLFMLLLAINLLGDGIRDVTAPESRN